MIIIIIIYKGRKYNLEINEADTVKVIMEKFYNKINLNYNERFYTKDKMIFKFNEVLLNDNEEHLNKTAEELELQDDDGLTLVKTQDINAGKKIIN